VNQNVKPVRLGRGLSALLGDYAGARNAIDETMGDVAPANEPGAISAPAPGVRELPIDQVVANSKQPRRTFPNAEMEELAESIRTKGVIQPILVRPDPTEEGKFEIVAGERRWRAARRAGLSVVPVVVREMDDRESLEIAIIENVQRLDLNPVEEAEAYKSLIDRFARTQESIAQQVGKSREHVSNTMRLLNLPDDVREHVREGRLTAGHARALLKTEDASKLAEQVISRGLSVRDTEALAKKDKEGQGALEIKSAVGALARSTEDKDVDTKALELDLQRSLGLDVDIRHSAKGGEVRIKYAQLEQLDEICRLLTRPRIVVPGQAAE
jgi:ParB family chromosome partitioning protein